MSSTEEMKKLSPSDPIAGLRYRVSFTIVFKPGIIISRVVKELMENNIKGIDLLGENTISVTITFKQIGDNVLKRLFNVLEEHMNGIQILCYELRLLTTTKSIDNIPLHIVKLVRLGDSTVSLAKLGDKYVWIYVNRKKDKAVLKFIEGRLTGIEYMDPTTIPQSLFITCRERMDPKELFNEIIDRLKRYHLAIAR